MFSDLTKVPVYRCEFIRFCNAIGVPISVHDAIVKGTIVRAQVRMGEEHLRSGTEKGGVIITSAVRSIDFEMGVLATQHSLYVFSDQSVIRKKQPRNDF